MDKSPKPTREDDLSTANQTLNSSGSEECTMPTGTVTGDCATGNPDPAIHDEEHAEATKERPITSSPESSSKPHKLSTKHTHVTFLDPITLAESEFKKSEVGSKTEHTVSAPIPSLSQKIY